MRAMVLHKQGAPLSLTDVPTPEPAENEVRLRVRACGVCRTDLHVVDGELQQPKLPLVPGHQIVGEIDHLGANVGRFHIGQRVGVPWLGGSCGHCRYCTSEHENLCDSARYTGYQLDGGFAEYCVADARYCFPIPEEFTDSQAAPLLCAGLIGYRALSMVGDAVELGFYGFGAAAHLLIQVASYQRRHVHAFTRAHDVASQAFARELGAVWAGASEEKPPVELDAAIIFAPVGELVPLALRSVRKGGVVVCAGIHMSDIPSFAYSALWGERVLRSVANLTRRDGEEFFRVATETRIASEVKLYALQDANQALADLRNGALQGAAVIQVVA